MSNVYNSTGIEGSTQAPPALVPKNYRLITTRETNAGERIAEVYYNADSRQYYIVLVTVGRSAGPFNRNELGIIGDMIKDAEWLGNNPTYLE